MAGSELSPLKQALLALERMQARLDQTEHAASEPIAIVGMACRLPGAGSVDAFWEGLVRGQDGITRVPRDRWDADAHFDPDPRQASRIATRHGGFLTDLDRFDARFFAISPREAAHLDPQQRLLLEVSWEALEAAGQAVDRLAGSATGVFIGLLNSEYFWLQARDLASIDAYSGTGTSGSVASGRLSYCFGFEGPSVTLDTACSSSLVTVHLACQALRARECALALAGGVSVMLSPLSLLSFTRMGLLAPDGRCKTLDRRADGFVGGEGCGMVVLKRLSDAVADGDTIHALVLGSAVNQDGRTNVLSAPNGRAQEAVIRRALDAARVDPSAIGYVEMHGTGTPYGDPIEVDALRAVFGKTEGERGSLVLGAVKTNIGHTGGAAGVAGLIKAVLALEHRTIPPNLHFTELNPHVSFDGTPFRVPTAPIAWTNEGPRHAGVSAFGWSGTNAHVVLGEAPASTPAVAAADASSYVVPLSARDAGALAAHAASLRAMLADAANAPRLADVAYTAAVRRSHHPHRLSLVGSTSSAIVERIDALLASKNGGPATLASRGHRASPRRPPLVFVFSPHGSQWTGMGRRLLEQLPVFREAIEACGRAMAPWVDWSVIDVLEGRADAGWMERIDVLQPTLFALQVALAAAWRAWGIEPDAIVGHSMGEVAAAHVAGALPLDAAARVICRRTTLLRRVSGHGAMGIVELSRAETIASLARFDGRLTVAASNSPRFTVVGGEARALEELFEELEGRQVFCGWGVADVASHTPQMNAIAPELASLIGELQVYEARVPLYSTVTGTRVAGPDLGTDYWARHLSRPVLFADAMRTLADGGHEIFLEIAPGPVLGPAIDDGLTAAGVAGATLSSMARDADDCESLLAALGRLYTLGVGVDWSRVYPSGKVVALPAYPWQRERHWLAASTEALLADRGEHAMTSRSNALGTALDVATEPARCVWTRSFDARVQSAAFAHRVAGAPVFPASGFVEIALAAAGAVSEHAAVTGLELERALVLSDQSPWTQLQVTLDAPVAGNQRLVMHARSSTEWRRHASGVIADTSASTTNGDQTPAFAAQGESAVVSSDSFYQELEAAGVVYDTPLRVLGEIRSSGDCCDAALRLTASTVRAIETGEMPAAAIDAIFQLSTWTVWRRASNAPFVPARVGRVSRPVSGVVPVRARVQVGATSEDAVRCDACLLDAEGNRVVSIDEIEFVPLERAIDADAHALFDVEWQPSPTSVDRARTYDRWIVLSDAGGVGAAMVRALRATGADVALLEPASSLQRVDDRTWRVRPDVASDLQDALGPILASRPVRPVVVHLRSLDAPEGHALVDAALDCTAGPLLALLAAVNHHLPETPCPFWLVSRNAVAIGRGGVSLAQAPLWGVGFVLAEEHHDRWGGLIDLDRGVDVDRDVSHLLASIACTDGEDRLAWRGDVRHVARLVPHAGRAAGRPDSVEEPPVHIHSDGAYLITGGLGDIGLEVARWLADRGARRLVLLGRTPLPDRATWRELEHAPDSPTRRRVAAVRALEQRGVSVHPAAVDVAEEGQLAAWLHTYDREGWPPIRGVVHCAGVIEDRLLTELTIDSLRRVTAPKIRGAWNLHHLLRDRNLDLFVLFSSSAALMGALGQASYAAGNVFLDAFSHARRAEGLPAISIEWGFWRDRGFATTVGGRRAVAYGEKTGLVPFAVDEALDLFGRILAAPPAATVAALRIDRDRWRGSSGAGVAPLLRALAGTIKDEAVPDRRLRDELDALDAAALRRRLRAFLRGELAAVLRLDPERLDDETPLGTFGIDSFMAIELRNRVERQLDLPLSATLVWNYPTIAAMASHLADRLEPARVPTDSASDGPAAAAGDVADVLAQLDALSDDELQGLLGELAAEDASREDDRPRDLRRRAE